MSISQRAVDTSNLFHITSIVLSFIICIVTLCHGYTLLICVVSPDRIDPIPLDFAWMIVDLIVIIVFALYGIWTYMIPDHNRSVRIISVIVGVYVFAAYVLGCFFMWRLYLSPGWCDAHDFCVSNKTLFLDWYICGFIVLVCMFIWFVVQLIAIFISFASPNTSYHLYVIELLLNIVIAVLIVDLIFNERYMELRDLCFNVSDTWV